MGLPCCPPPGPEEPPNYRKQEHGPLSWNPRGPPHGPPGCHILPVRALLQSNNVLWASLNEQVALDT